MDLREVVEFFKDAFKYIIVVVVVLLVFIFVVGLQQVVGPSMNPTLEGNTSETEFTSDYGIIDKNNNAKHNLKRYQIVTTYYPGDSKDAAYKIKRVLAKPGETFKIEDYQLYVYNYHTNNWGEPLEMPFDRAGIDDGRAEHKRHYKPTTLKDNEYFLAGDNWGASYDSFSVGPINFDLLVGVVVKIQGKCKVKDGKVIAKQKTADRYFLGVNY